MAKCDLAGDPGQTDEAEMGLQYDIVDQVLYLLVDERLDPERVIDMGFERALVERVERSVRNMQYKRMTAIIASRPFMPRATRRR